MPTDKDNNLYLLEFGEHQDRRARRQDPKTKIWTDAGRPIRGRAAAGSTIRAGCGSPNIGGNAIGMFDPKTQKIKEWKLPTPWSDPYDVGAAKDGTRLDRLDADRSRDPARSQDG